MIIVVTDSENHVPETQNGTLQKQLELCSAFDAIFYTKDCKAIRKKELKKFCSENGAFVSTLPPILASDSYGLFMGPIFSVYVRIKCFLQVCFQTLKIFL